MSGDATAVAIARWVQRHPKEIRAAIGSAFAAARELRVAPWLFTGEAWKIRRKLLLDRLHAIDGLRLDELPDVVAAYQVVASGRRQATNDPLGATFAGRLKSLVDIEDNPDDADATYQAWLRWRFKRRRRLARQQVPEQPCRHGPIATARWRPCRACGEAIRWSAGEYFASVGDAFGVAYGEVVRIIERDRILVRIYQPAGPSFLDEYGSWPALLSCRLTRQQMDRAAQLGWPRAVETLRAILDQTPVAGAA